MDDNLMNSKSIHNHRQNTSTSSHQNHNNSDPFGDNPFGEDFNYGNGSSNTATANHNTATVNHNTATVNLIDDDLLGMSSSSPALVEPHTVPPKTTANASAMDSFVNNDIFGEVASIPPSGIILTFILSYNFLQ